jgi:tetratricopeptide (TPR) repeat protein
MIEQPLRVFISSKMEELAAERDAVQEALDRLHVKAWVFEKDAGARPSTIQETYLGEIEAADLYIGIFWKGYGAYTIEEYEHAQTLGMDCLIYEKRSTPEDPRDPALQKFLDRIGGVTEGLTLKRFQTAESLAVFVAEDVAAWQASIVRERGARSAPAIYSGVPPMTARVVGREPIVRQLVVQLRAGEDLAIEGLPGVGKTSLAVVLTRHPGVRRRFRDGILWASLGPNAEVTSALVRWADALGKGNEGGGDAERAQTVRDAIGDRRMLLVIDDVWDVEAARTLRCGGPNCAHLLTTRDKAIARAFAGAPHAKNLPTLDNDQSSELLRILAPEAWEANPAAARVLLDTAAGLPLAIRLIGGYLAAPERALFPDLFPDLSEEAFAELNDPHKRLELAEQRLGGRSSEPSTLRETVLLSLEGLPRQVRQAFYSLGAFEPMPARFSREAAEAVTTAGARLLAVLAARNLLEIEEQGRQLTLHRTISDVAHSGLDSAARDRHGEYYFRLVADGRNRYDHWLIMDHFPQMSRAWRNAPEDKRLLEWLVVMRPFFNLRDAWSDYLTWTERALNAAVRLGLADWQSALLADRGVARFNLEDWPGALALSRDALQLLEVSRDHRGSGRVLCNIGMCQHALGDSKAALETIHRAVAILKECGDVHGLVDALDNLSNVHSELGDDLEDRVFREEANILRKDDPPEKPYPTEIHIVRLPALTRSMREHPRLLTVVEALIKSRNAPTDFEGQLAIGVRQEDDRALRWWQARFEKGKEPVTAFVGNRPVDADVTVILPEREADAMLLGGLRDNGKAVVHGDRELLRKFGQYVQRKIPEEVNPPDQEAAKLLALGVVLGSKGQHSLALENLDEAIKIWEGLIHAGRDDLQDGLAEGLHARAQLLGRSKRYDEALRDYGEAIRLRSQLVDHDQRADLRKALADSLRRRGLVLIVVHKFAEAAGDFGAAIALEPRTENLDATGMRSLAEDYRYRALARQFTEDRAGAADDLGQAVEIYSKLVDSRGESEFGDRLIDALARRAELLSDAGRLAEALQDYDRAVELGRRQMQREEQASDAALAANLCKRAKTHSRNSDRGNALHDLEEAVGQYRELVERRGRADLARNLADACFDSVFAMEGSRQAEAKPMLDEALERYTRLAVEQDQEDLRARLSQAHELRAIMEGLPLGEALEDFGAAIAIYQDLLEHGAASALAVDLGRCFMHRAERQSSHGRFAEAIEDYERAVALETPLLAEMPERVSSNLFSSLNDLAWIRATCPDASLRNGQLAIELATRACELTEWGNYQGIDTLAASYAELGDFARAVEWQLRAAEQASEGETAEVQARLALYRAGKSYHEAHIGREPHHYDGPGHAKQGGSAEHRPTIGDATAAKAGAGSGWNIGQPVSPAGRDPSARQRELDALVLPDRSKTTRSLA